MVSLHSAEVHLIADPPMDVERVHHVRARAASGIDAVEISLRWDKVAGPAEALALLESAVATLREHADKVRPLASAEEDGRRWHG